MEARRYGYNQKNIGNMKGQEYADNMLLVYQQCWNVLKPGGLAILVTKNFLRHFEEVNLDLITINLMGQAGFELIDWHFRKITAQSFWRVIYHKKYPSAPTIDKEDILVFRKVGQTNGRIDSVMSL
jgi:hypothetical protein